MNRQQLDEERIFHVARTMKDFQIRAEYFDQVCAGDQALRERVEALLEVHEQERDFLASEPAGPAPTEDHTPLTERPGSTIGRYKLMEQIGEGGMGVVFVAEQERPIRRKVALKVIKPGMDTKTVIARFEAERQALAMMDHPNIAKVLDAGTTDSGRPYFVMELVRGITITDYCDQNKLTIRERLELFIHVCNAIQHAHQKGIIHRDIKPSNVLVTLHNDLPVPKVIDFGVAKAINARLTDRTVYTEHFQVVGTLLYMSPEQAHLSGLDVDTRSDIYSLGVLLYELLTGTTPFRSEELDHAGFDEQRKIIREQEPPRASMRISSLGQTATTVAEHRKTDSHKLHQQVRGDLDWIVLKALDKDRTRRYDSAATFAADVGRHLRDEAVIASPPSTLYRFKKFARRNRALILGATLVSVSLIAGTAISTVLAVQKAQAVRTLADKVSERDAALANWQQELYRRALNAAFSGNKTSVRNILAEAHTLSDEPLPWENKINALLDLFSGRVERAANTLREAVNATPDDPGAVALLAIAFLQSGKHDKYIETRNQLRHLSSQSSFSDWSAEDRSLVGQALQFGDIAEGLKVLQPLVDKHPSPLALAFHSQALMKRYYDGRNEDDRNKSIRELDAAKLLMPNCAFLEVLDLWAHMPLTPNEELSPEREARLDAAAQALAEYPDYPSGRHSRACYFDFKKLPEKARREWDAVASVGRGGYMSDYFAAFEYREGKIQKAKDLLRGSHEESVMAAIHLGEVLAFEKGNEAEARELYESAARRIGGLSLGPDDFVGIPETILLLLDHQDEASDILRQRAQSKSPWQKKMLEFLANPDISPDELLKSSDTGSYSDLMAHKLIAIRYLSQGDTQRAAEHFDACQKIMRWQPDAFWAQAYLSILRPSVP